MDKDNLIAYMGLQEIIEKHSPDIDKEKLAGLIVANFEVKQLFNKGPDVETGVAKDKSENIEQAETVVEEDPDVAYDKEYKERQMTEAKSKLVAMREEAYGDAMRAQYFPEDNPDVDFNLDSEGDPFGNETTEEMANRLKQEYNRDQKHNKMLSGAGGFTRSDG